MEKPDIFPATMLTDVTDPAAKHSITFTLRDYISYIDWIFSYLLFLFCFNWLKFPRSLLIKENSDVQEHLDTDFACREQAFSFFFFNCWHRQVGENPSTPLETDLLKTYKRRYSCSKFRNFTDDCQPRPQGAFLWLLLTSNASKKCPGARLDVCLWWGAQIFKLAGATSSLTYDVFLSKLASLQILRRSLKWCRWIFLLPGPGQLVPEGSLLYPCQDFICKGIVTQEKYIHFKLSAWLNKYGIV